VTVSDAATGLSPSSRKTIFQFFPTTFERCRPAPIAAMRPVPSQQPVLPRRLIAHAARYFYGVQFS
jgi:hypothetical protein